MITRSSKALLALSLLSLAAATGCSSSTEGGGNGGGTEPPPAAFSKYCTGTLSKSVGLLPANGPGQWAGTNSDQAAVGTEFLLSADFGQWGGYVIQSNGAPAELDASFSTGLVLGTDFTSSCAPSSSPGLATTHFVLLAPVTLYATSALTGTPCTLAAGTELTEQSFTSDGSGPAQIASPEIAAKCGTTAAMYSNDLSFGDLIGH